MPRRALSDTEVEAYRQQIVEAAAQMLAEHGPEALSMRAVAEQLGVSAMTLYRYVADKAQMLAWLHQFAARALEQTQRAAARTAADPIQRLHRLGRALVSFARKQPHVYRLLFDPDAEDRQWVDRARAPMLAAFTEAVEQERLAGDPTTLTDICFAALHGTVCLNAGDDARMNALSVRVIELLLAAATTREK